MSYSFSSPFPPVSKKPLLVVLSSPSGAGKDAVLSKMKEQDFPIEFITTCTTRLRRATERNHIDYHFITKEKFQEMITHNEFLEWANVYGNLYGTPKMPVVDALKRGRDVILKVDVQGVSQY